MSRIAEASARAGRAVPDNSPVDWAKEREAAERLLSGAAAEQAAPRSPAVVSSPISDIEQAVPPPPIVASSLASDSIEQTFAWPPEFNLDEVDLSRDPHARDFRRPRPITQRRVEVDDQIPPRHSQLRYESVASSLPPRVSAGVVPPPETAASSKRGPHRELRAEPRRVTPQWVMVAVALMVLLASAALLMYFLRHRQVAAGPPYVRPLHSAWLAPTSVAIAVSPNETGTGSAKPSS